MKKINKQCYTKIANCNRITIKIKNKKGGIRYEYKNDVTIWNDGYWDACEGWRDVFSGLLGGLAPSPTLDQLNGKWPIIHFSKPCGPYGIGGTPNSCNGI